MAQVTVTIQNMAYSPDPVKVKAGDTIVWTNKDDMPHTATAKDNSFNTGNIRSGASSKPISFPKAGKVPYFCKIHGQSMAGTVEVS